MHVYPATYYLDVTNDGVKDLIVTTNSELWMNTVCKKVL
jgi:hypothetical protein